METTVTVESSFSLSLEGGLSAPMYSVEAGVELGMGWTWSKSTSTTTGMTYTWKDKEKCGYWYYNPVMAHSCGSVTQCEPKPGQLNQYGQEIRRRGPRKFSPSHSSARYRYSQPRLTRGSFHFSPGLPGRCKKGCHRRKRVCGFSGDDSRV
jgi:hypothetical protein